MFCFGVRVENHLNLVYVLGNVFVWCESGELFTFGVRVGKCFRLV